MTLDWAVHHLAVAIAELDTAIARRMGLTSGDYLALKHLATAAPPIGPVELGRLLGITSGAATGLVDRLERAGYVRRGPHPDDRRRQVVSTTAKAEGGMLRELRPLADDIDRVAADLDAEQRRLVTDVLARLTETHRDHARHPPRTPAGKPPRTPAGQPPRTPAGQPPRTPAGQPPRTPAGRPPRTPGSAG
ncbi:MarR family transcriptional regulator [Asanoa sp. WMMD1127]|uniref:MarR family winged helix-turn-helix transcriptional regulator n=1 Tax=Asanoa sp. WMMD1127 TaxID=3016107 RepID=UPI002416E803|nr:MarR family transcriptional regulator [Asanoa sp. WMMD1127]MDG4823402.1 MarR family transcriptional regulator [Asanoa sp. WMMD1127]